MIVMERILMLTMLHLMLNWPRFNYHDRWSLQRTCKKYLPPVLVLNKRSMQLA